MGIATVVSLIAFLAGEANRSLAMTLGVLVIVGLFVWLSHG